MGTVRNRQCEIWPAQGLRAKPGPGPRQGCQLSVRVTSPVPVASQLWVGILKEGPQILWICKVKSSQRQRKQWPWLRPLGQVVGSGNCRTMWEASLLILDPGQGKGALVLDVKEWRGGGFPVEVLISCKGEPEVCAVKRLDAEKSQRKTAKFPCK